MEDREALLLITGMLVVPGGAVISGVELEMVFMHTQCNFQSALPSVPLIGHSVLQFF